MQTSAQGLGCFQVPDLSFSAHGAKEAPSYKSLRKWERERERDLGQTWLSQSSLNFREIWIHLWIVWLSGMAFALGDWIKVKLSFQWASLFNFLIYFFFSPNDSNWNTGSRLPWSLENFGLDSDLAMQILSGLDLRAISCPLQFSTGSPVCFSSSGKFLETVQAWNLAILF